MLGGDGQIAIGSIGPIACAAVANDEHNMLAALVRRPEETLQQLLERLDRAVQLALEDEIFTDEINAPRHTKTRLVKAVNTGRLPEVEGCGTPPKRSRANPRVGLYSQIQPTGGATLVCSTSWRASCGSS